MDRSIAAAAGLAIPALKLAIAVTQASIGMIESARSALLNYIEHGADGGIYGMSSGLLYLARVELALDELDGAAEHARHALEVAGSLKNPSLQATALHAFASVALRRGDPTEAERLGHQALALAAEHELPPNLAAVLDLLAGTAAALESHSEAAMILGASDRAREELGRVCWAAEEAILEQLRGRLGAVLGDEAFAAALADGQAMGTATRRSPGCAGLVEHASAPRVDGSP
jgi:hypothetical protein